MLEKELEKYLTEKIKTIGGLAYKFVSPGNAGVPDRIIVTNNKVTFVELKTSKGYVSPQQIKQISKLTDRGMDVFIIRTKEQVDELINHLSYHLHC